MMVAAFQLDRAGEGRGNDRSDRLRFRCWVLLAVYGVFSVGWHVFGIVLTFGACAGAAPTG